MIAVFNNFSINFNWVLNQEDIIGKSDSEIFPAEVAEKFIEHDTEVFKRHTPVEFEEQTPHKDGSRTFIAIKFPLYDVDHEHTALCGILTDITARKHAEVENLRLQNLLNNIINSMPSVLIGVNSDGRITQWNYKAAKYTGIPSEKAQGKILDSVYPEFKDQLEQVRKAITQRKPQGDNKVAHEQNGEVRFNNITVYPLISNGVEGAVIRIDDVTEHVRIEEMIIQSEKMLSVGGLAAGMAHEINNPLAGILQNIQLIRKRLDMDSKRSKMIAEQNNLNLDSISKFVEKSKISDMIELIMQSGIRAAKIVDNMLRFSRKSDSKFTSQSLTELMDKTMELAENDYDLKKQYDFKKIEIVREYSPDMPDVECVASEIQQVFLNLLKNSAQAMNDKFNSPEAGELYGHPQFILRIRRDRDMAQIEIEDNGPGIPEPIRKRIFEPFFTTKSVGIGTGLGLSVSFFIITENHHGTMSIESNLNKGVKFIIRIPLKQ